MGRTVLLLILSNVFTGSMFFLLMDTTELYKSPLVALPVITSIALVGWLIGWMADHWDDD